MKKTIIWKGIYYNSLEYFQLFEMEGHFLAKSKIIGTSEDKNYLVEYEVSMSKNWEALGFKIESTVNGNHKKIEGIKRSDEWEINGKVEPTLNGYNFIDISLSPFTNTLPIKNLHLKNSQEQQISVIYFDILNDRIEPVNQKYHKNSETKYRYENIPKDFTADIEIDEFGLVKFYPELFERVILEDGFVE